MIYIPTQAGQAAMRTRDALSLRERQILMLCNGARPLERLRALLGPHVGADVQALSDRGLIAPASADHCPGPWPNTAPMHHESTMPQHSLLFEHLPDEALPPAAASGPAPDSPPEGATAPALGQAFSQGPERVPAWAWAQLQDQLKALEAAHQGQPPALPAAHSYMNQILGLFAQGPAAQVLHRHRHAQQTPEILQYLAQGLGVLLGLGGADLALRVAIGLGQLLPMPLRARLLDGAMDYVPTDFNLRLYEAVLPSARDGSPA